MVERRDRFTFDRFTLFFVLLLCLGLVTTLLFLNPLELATGRLHPEFSSMLHSGNNVSLEPSLKLLSYFYGLTIFCLLVTAIYIGGRKAKRLSGFRNVVLVFSFLYLATYTIMMFSYWDYMHSSSAVYFLGFPAPSAWMVYAIHLFPFLLIFFYAVKFHRYILSKKEIDAFLHKKGKTKDNDF